MPSSTSPKVHLVYAVPYAKRLNSGLLSRAEAKVRPVLRDALPKSYRRGRLPGQSPLSAPYSITRNLFDYLSERVETVLYDWREKSDIHPSPGDVLLGHPHPDVSTIVSRAFRNENGWRARILLFPLHHGIPSINEYALPLMAKADAVLGIMGEYWYDNIDESFLAPHRSKITRLDMAINAREYPIVKTSYNPPGKRGYFYIGSNLPEKGTDILSETMLGLRDHRCSWIGWGPDIPGLQRLAIHMDLTPENVRRIAKDHDFFVNTSISDANPTTILESMAWGFPVACTPESGYYNIPTIHSLSSTDVKQNIDTLGRLQTHPEHDLRETAHKNRSLVEKTFTWDRFCSAVWARLEPFL